MKFLNYNMMKILAIKPFIIVGTLMTLFIVFLFGCVDITDRLHHYIQEAHLLWNFNGSVMISWNGRVLLSKGYGWANTDLTIPNTPQTKYFIGSITKQFTSEAIMILNERGLINLHGTINNYLPEFHHPEAKRITIHQLLTHTSGLPNYTDNIGLYIKRTEDIDPDFLVKLIEKQKLLFDPGSGFYYSNSGYVLLGAIIEAVSGQSYEAFLHKEIFKPLGMANTGYGRRVAGHPDRADGYTLNETGLLESAVPLEFSFLHSAGALYSTTEDLLKWEKALHSNQIISESSYNRMIRDYGGIYGYGWFIQKKYNTYHTYHDGLIDGYNAIVDRWPEYGLSIIILSNDDMSPVNKMAEGLAAICYGMKSNYPIEKKSIIIQPEDIIEYVGVFKSDDGLYNIVNIENDKLYIRQINRPRQFLEPQAIDTFFYELDNSQTVIFHRNLSDDIVSIEINDDNLDYISLKLSDMDAKRILINRTRVDISQDIIRMYAGTYRMNSGFSDFEELFVLEVLPADSGIIVKMTANEALKLYPNSNESFFHVEADMQLTFSRNILGEVTGCILRLGLTEIMGEKIESNKN